MNALRKPCKSELMANNRKLGVQLTQDIWDGCADVHNCSHTICIVLRAQQLRERILSTTWPTTSFSSGLLSTICAAAKPLLSVCHYPLPCFCFIISHFPSTLFLHTHLVCVLLFSSPVFLSYPELKPPGFTATTWGWVGLLGLRVNR